MREWTFAAITPFEVLCVCSDQTVGNKSNDDAVNSVAELAFPVTSDVEEIRRFLGGSGKRVIFSTYQSSSVITTAQADPATPSFDLAVADEAHRCAGKAGGDFTAILDNCQIRSTKRLFATATPRTYSTAAKKAAEDRDVDVVGMDNVTLFGEVMYSLPFGKAIAKKLLTDYRVVIIGVDDPTIAQCIANRSLVVTGTGMETDSESLAAQIGLLKAIKDYDLKRIISFHSRVSRAEYFSAAIHTTMQWIGDEHRPSGKLGTDFVSGKMTANRRKIKLDKLKSLPSMNRGLLSNARCLSEGVDVPALDGVAFIDPRSSQIDIIQAVGRAIRQNPDKKIGTIVLPVFIGAGHLARDMIEASNFKPIWDVLNALKAHDDILAIELDQIRIDLGRRSSSFDAASALRKVTIDLPSTIDSSFSTALSTYLVEQVTASWNYWLGLVQAFSEREGHARVPADYKSKDGYRIGQWVSSQRNKEDSLPPERKARLESLPGWSWDPLSEYWETVFCSLKEFSDREGNINIPKNLRSANGFMLSAWIQNQRTKRHTMQPERKEKLEALSGWTWDVLSDVWEGGFRHLKDFADREGHIRIPPNFKAADGYQLASWINNQRTKKDRLLPERKARLDSFPGWSWGLIPDMLEEGFSQLVEFVNREGHANVPHKYRNIDGYRIGVWVSTQRSTRDKMSSEHKARLEALAGWRWSEPSTSTKRNWDESFNLVREFVELEGHARLPVNLLSSDGQQIGRWVGTQRGLKDKLSPDRRASLEALQGWSWDAVEMQWEIGFQNLKEFSDQEGHAITPVNFIMKNGYRVGRWVGTQRGLRSELSTERKFKLEALPGWAWDPLEEQWEEGFRRLSAYVDREGHAKVPNECRSEDGYRIGGWVAQQRKIGKGMTSEHEARLEALPGWTWDVLSDVWEDVFRHLKDFADREGHVRIPKMNRTASGCRIDLWASNQRKRIVTLSPDRKSRLEALPGWILLES